MKILVIYATNSGGTYLAAQIAEEILSGLGHEISLKKAGETDPLEIINYDSVILGSNSWNYNKAEGQPHEEMRKLLEKITGANISLEGKKFAVFGLGDSSYMYFCGAVDVLEKFLREKKAALLTPSLRIDGFFLKQVENTEKVKRWATELGKTLKFPGPPTATN